MTDEELQAHIETLGQHVARLDGIIQVILEEIEAGTILESVSARRCQRGDGRGSRLSQVQSSRLR